MAAYKTNEITAAAGPARRQVPQCVLSTKPIAAGDAVNWVSWVAKGLLWLLAARNAGPSRDKRAAVDYLWHLRVCHD